MKENKNINLIDKLLNNGWEEGHEVLYKKINDTTYYYNIYANTFSYEDSNCGIIEYLCKGTLKELEKIENNLY